MNLGLWNLEIHVRIAGVMLILLAVLNLFLPARFSWGEELKRLTPLTRQVFVSHCTFIVLILLMMGVLAVGFAPALLERTTLATVVLFGLAAFWVVRLGMQFFFYSPKLWRGDRFNTAMHVLLSGVWAYFSAVFSTAWVVSMR